MLPQRPDPRRLRRALRRSSGLLPYWATVLVGETVERQVAALPRDTRLGVQWLELSRLRRETDVRTWRQPHHGFAVPGGWDRELVRERAPITEPADPSSPKAMTHRTVRMLFLDGASHRATPQYEAMVRAVEQGEPSLAYGCRTRVEVDAYFERLRGTHDRMRDVGYLTQRELGEPGGDEIKVYVLRDGTLCHGNGGNHRARIAEILGVRWVPVLVAGAHASWLTRLARGSGAPPRRALGRWLTGPDAEQVGLRPSRPATQRTGR